MPSIASLIRRIGTLRRRGEKTEGTGEALPDSAEGNRSALERPPARRPPPSPKSRAAPGTRAWKDASHTTPPAGKKKSVASKIKSTLSGLTGWRSKRKEKPTNDAVTCYSNRSDPPKAATRQATRQDKSAQRGDGKETASAGQTLGSSETLAPGPRELVAQAIDALYNSTEKHADAIGLSVAVHGLCRVSVRLSHARTHECTHTHTHKL